VNYNQQISNLIDIFNGYSSLYFNGEHLFLKHFCLRDQYNISKSYTEYLEIAKKRGLESESIVYQKIIASKEWTDNDELEMAQLKKYVSNLKLTKEKLLLPSEKENHQKLIDEENEKLVILLNKKNELLGVTAENFANKMANEEFLRMLIYKDTSLKKLRFSKIEFGELANEDVIELTNKYSEISKSLNDDSIQEIILQDFFNVYFSYCENAKDFFGKAINKLSAYQMKLSLYSKILNNIFQYHDDIPEYMRKDAKSIFLFVESKKGREKFQSSSMKDGGTAIFGATKKDMEMIDPNSKKLSLSSLIEKNGGSLNMDQMMDLMR
jgi:hypothetical protein